ncbi:MAG: prepilin-type N-terminal cleavage/methylation domain-containing protein [Opitutaceae bacterium]|nr:prepilin-type N-terminal cleavage/methylation domain-containing protein [Opitutaceae bacterium]
MKISSPPRRRTAGFTLVEAMMAGTIASLVMAGTMATFMFGFRTMYKDNQRLATNATLRYFIAQVSKETLDATEFYVFPNYKSLDGNVDLVGDVSSLQADAFGTFLAYGDCLVLVTRVSATTTANVRQIRIYYRVTTDSEEIAPVRYYESTNWGAAGTSTALGTLINAINLSSNPTISGSRVIVNNARGRQQTGGTTVYPIFSTESATTSPTNDSVSINVEVINGASVNNMLSSSSFNYTISPRK